MSCSVIFVSTVAHAFMLPSLWLLIKSFSGILELIIIFITMSTAFTMWGFLGNHIIYASEDITSLDFFADYSSSDKKRLWGSKNKMENLKTVLGDNMLLWIFPIYTTKGDGIVYKRRGVEDIL